MGGEEKKVFPFCSFWGCCLPDSYRFLFPTYCREGRDLTSCSKSALILLFTAKGWKDSTLVVFFKNLWRESKYELFPYVHFYIWMSSSSLLYTGRMPGEFSIIRYFSQYLKDVLAYCFFNCQNIWEALTHQCFLFKDRCFFTFYSKQKKNCFSEYSLDSRILARS